jgi:hypothetical protein
MIEEIEEYFLPGESPISRFIELFNLMLIHSEIIIDGLANLEPINQITSAKSVHSKIIGILSSDHKDVYFFPEMLIKNLGKPENEGFVPPVFCKKNYLLKMLSRESFIIRTEDNSVERRVWYHGVPVKAWQIDWYRFSNYSH